ncbi:MAG: 1-deoxy-D-xylulose-5-phosphate reductoisomerase, partial [Candidatus Omnitrophica bacterium]|nr:1-deoxy-D-xylulose-5-phosphate reductoisomerase [Candidatus Omnitrophota bacterium]
MRKTHLVILGSTGSIGVNTLDVVSRYPDRFQVVGLSAYNNLKLLEAQVQKFLPKYIAVSEPCIADFRRRVQGKKVKILSVESDLCQLVTLASVDLVVIGMTGSGALQPFLAAVRAGKTVAPANKEALVMAGDILMRAAKTHKAKIIPVDSEQSAIFQCLEGQNRRDLQSVYLTASGGALWKV